jgi:hypothetical protein
MLKKICDIIKIEDNYILQPRCNNKLENLCMVNNSKHDSEYFNTDHIFDLRSLILNKSINSEIHFYLLLFDENMKEINLKEDNYKKCLIYTFNRKKNKKIRKTILNYHPIIEEFKIQNKLTLSDKTMLYLGNSKKVNCKQVAFENSGCISNFYSENGGGFYGFQFGLKNLSKIPKSAILFGYKNEQNVINNGYLNNNIERIINTETKPADIPVIYAVPIEDEYIEPTAPPMEEIMPSAPPEELIN